MTLGELIGLLEVEGARIVYSTQLVPEGKTVSLDSPTLDVLEEALKELGLTLRYQQGVIAIVRGPEYVPVAEAESVASALEDEPQLETVIVTGSRHRFFGPETTNPTRSYSSSEIGAQPLFASDPLRVTTRLPGVSTLGVSARPHIRGGLSDELLIIRNGIELLEPFHLADFHSAYSAIDISSLDSLDIYTGGFPARYGNRMSGVMDLQTRERSEQRNLDIGFSTFATRVALYGDVDFAEGGNFLLSWRGGDLDDVASFIEHESGVPEYSDLSASFHVDLTPDSSVAFGFTQAKDDILFVGDLVGQETALSKVVTDHLWAEYLVDGLGRWRTRLTGSAIDLSRRNEQFDNEEIEQDQEGGFLQHQQDVLRVAVRNDWIRDGLGTTYELGWQAEFNRGRYQHQSEIERGVIADLIGTPRNESRDINLKPEGWSGGGYVQMQVPVGERLVIQPGMRIDFQDYYIDRGFETQLSPRLGVAYTVSDEMTVRLDLGRFQQPEAVQELQVRDGLDRFFQPQIADQVAVALEWRGGSLLLRGEAYYKQYRRPKGRFENLFNPFVLLPQLEEDRVEIQPDQVYASGFDVSVERAFSRSITGDLSYSYMDAKDRIEGRSIPRRWSQRHTMNLGMRYELGDFSLAGALTWHSGWNSTALPSFIADGDVVPVSSILNNSELPEFLSLDVSARKVWDFPRVRIEVFADVSNLTDRKNIAGIDFDERRVEGGYALEPEREFVLGRVTSLGVTLSF
ncbi:TonB-dependent receptor plug domain-containing protein [Congregibacter litoralis]|uniref:Outer membrane receptor protein, mostly Fe transport n=1 Tax=Congregibacter litoralis KT71 TaxID=314285 RepID=A4AAE7_9GAMM|nr:TonB-dependent receptor [Congregibacter litoralis]EAQ97024.2 Outer membrane receptor protein, mostly Fe transport [Congregibacter litoralis KT71]